jgi:hypothetical protein
MPDLPSKLWKAMPPDVRVAAADAFWRDDETSEVRLQQMEAVALLARRLNFRTRSIQALPIERRARHLAQVNDVTEGIATRALIAYHFQAQRPLMAAFLDALGIEHEDGLIKADEVTPPTVEQLTAAVAAIGDKFPSADVDLYLRTLATLDEDTWGAVERVVPLSR